MLLNVYRAFLERAEGREVVLLADRCARSDDSFRSAAHRFVRSIHSGGGHVALCLLYAIVSQSLQSLPLPHQLILISPNLNTEMNNPAIYSLAPYDPALSPEHCTYVNRLWAGGDPSVPVSEEDARNPTINPIVGDITLLKRALTPPVSASLLSPKQPLNGNGDALSNNGHSPEMQVVLVSGGYDVLHADILDWLEKADKAGLSVHYIEGVRQIHDFPTGRKLIWEGRIVTDRVIEVVKARSAELGFGTSGAENDGEDVMEV